ncbi:hypothetical protein O0L34_g9288 [Tuta absoluta]|nr:hypothetical protein O0L34_g9288 [Tuta absoluta]
MMEEVAPRPTVEYIPPLPPKGKRPGATTFTQITADEKRNGFDTERDCSMHSFVLNSKSPNATVFLAATQPERPASTPASDSPNGPHVVTIRINTDTDKPKAPKISSVHLKSEVDFDTLKINDLCKKNSTSVRLNVDESRPKILDNEEILKAEKPPYIYCNSFVNSMTNMVMSSGQCSPSDTLDSGTCSDLDGTPPPLPKKKLSKTSSTKKAVSVTVISSTRSNQGELDFEDNDSNISCDSLNSSELNGSVHADESHTDETSKKDKNKNIEPPAAPAMPSLTTKANNKDTSFLPQGLLQDIRDRSGKANTFEAESESNDEQQEASQNINDNANISKESAQLTSFRLVSQFNSDAKRNDEPESLPVNLCSKTPLITESTYEDRNKLDKTKQEMCYSSHYFDTDKFYDFHLNEKQFDDDKSVKSDSVGVKSDCDASEVEYFAGVKDFKVDEAPSTIRSSKGTIRGVKNRVRAGIATFLQMQNTSAKNYREKDAGKVVIYTTTMGIVRGTYQRCVLVKKILRNLLVKYEERDVFMSMVSDRRKTVDGRTDEG